MKLDICINQEGSCGYMYHLWYKEEDILTSYNLYLRPEDAVKDARKFVRSLNTSGWRVIRKKFYHEYEIDSVYLFESKDYGHCAIFVARGPLCAEAQTYYKRKKDLMKLINLILKSSGKITLSKDIRYE